MSRPNFFTYEGTPGVTEDDIAHLMIPGRYRSEDGMGLSDLTVARVNTAGRIYNGLSLADQGGIIVASGYKNPGDNSGEPWRSDDGTEYEGIPEAYSMEALLLGSWAIDKANIRVEPNSIDTVTNFTHSQDLFPDEHPVGIVAQSAHLERILDVIAPKTMRRPYIGIVVPEMLANPDIEGVRERVVSRWVSRGLKPDTQNASEIAEKRVQNIWKLILAAKSLKPTPHKVASA